MLLQPSLGGLRFLWFDFEYPSFPRSLLSLSYFTADLLH